MRRSTSICLTVCLLVAINAMGQVLQVSRIELNGLKRTKEVTVLRELDFAVGDTIDQENITQRFGRNRDNLLNTALFTDVEINISDWNTTSGQIAVQITMREAWYLYIVPIVELADRNVNVWVKEHDAAFDRVNIGIRAYHINLTGVRDRFKLKTHLGYTKKLETEYQLPYFNRQKTLGTQINVLWSGNKEVAYRNVDNKEIFYGDETRSVFERFRVRLGLQYRPNLYFTQTAEVAFHRNDVAPQIAQDDNPDFFLNGKAVQSYFSIRYKAEYDKRDLQLLPTKGPLLGIDVLKEGIGLGDINTLSISPYAARYFALGERWSIGTSVKAQYGLMREKPPFYNYLGLGYGRDYIRGYELYVINGMDFVYSKSNVQVKILNTMVDWKKKLPKAFRKMAVQTYLLANFDIGYVNDPFYAVGNPLVNRTLFGGGPAMSIVLYNTFAFHLEYNFNHQGERGFFLRTRTAF